MKAASDCTGKNAMDSGEDNSQTQHAFVTWQSGIFCVQVNSSFRGSFALSKSSKYYYLKIIFRNSFPSFQFFPEHKAIKS